MGARLVKFPPANSRKGQTETLRRRPLDRLFDFYFRYFGASTNAEKLLLVFATAFAFGYLELLVFFHRAWLLDADGHPLPRDFVAFWSAGRLAASGHALAAYDPRLQHAAEIATMHHPIAGSLGWAYPPLFLLAVALLAHLPYAIAFLVWETAILMLYGFAVSAIARNRIAFMAALAAPWVPVAFSLGQNGFLTAAIVGTVLLTLEERPLLSGIVLGLLGYKPQFGILFPFALAAGGRWRAFAAAAVATLAWNGLAFFFFGAAIFDQFFHTLLLTAHTHLVTRGLGWNRLQSVYGLVRTMGGANIAAWSAQASTTAAAAAAVFSVWRARVSHPVKCGVLAAAVALASPYVFFYDLPVLAVALAFLYRDRNFDRLELGLIAVAVPCVVASFVLLVPSALFASLSVAAIAARRFRVAFCAAGKARGFP